MEQIRDIDEKSKLLTAIKRLGTSELYHLDKNVLERHQKFLYRLSQLATSKYIVIIQKYVCMWDSNTDRSKMKKPILALVSRASIGISAL